MINMTEKEIADLIKINRKLAENCRTEELKEMARCVCDCIAYDFADKFRNIEYFTFEDKEAFLKACGVEK